MARKIFKKKYDAQNVLDAALQRIREAFDRFDHVVVSFSGGKDSTAVLNLALHVAREKNRLPLNVFTFDEEAIHPPTVDYIRRVSQEKDINFKWFCVPVKHRNACSRKQSWWYCWNPEEEEKWIRELPETAITHMPGFEAGMTVPEASQIAYPELKGTIIQLLGIRAGESMRRYRAVASRKDDNWLNLHSTKNISKGYPIYDWTAADVWLAPATFGWDYNRTYDVFEKLGMGLEEQRVCPPYGEEPLRGLWLYAEAFPEMWHKMLYRVHGVATAWRYANTDLYSVGLDVPPDGKTWKEYLQEVLKLYSVEDQVEITKAINSCIRLHNKKSKAEIPDSDPDLISGCSWKFLCKMALRGDFKGRVQQGMQMEGDKQRKRAGITWEEAVRRYAIDPEEKMKINPDVKK
jgi:predicted phosphoadenosine phosphosulfate sulfurtransferase